MIKEENFNIKYVSKYNIFLIKGYYAGSSAIICCSELCADKNKQEETSK